MAMGFGHLTHSGAMPKKSTISNCFVACILVFAPYVYIELPLGSSGRELQEGAPFLSNGIWATYTLRSYDKKFQKSPPNICFVVSNLVFAPYVYIELPVGSSRRELHF